MFEPKSSISTRANQTPGHPKLVETKLSSVKCTPPTPSLSEQSKLPARQQYTARFLTSLPADLMLHCLAHLNVPNFPPNLYCNEYNREVRAAKESRDVNPAPFSQEIATLTELLKTNHCLAALSFLPFRLDNVDSMIWLLRDLAANRKVESLRAVGSDYIEKIRSHPDCRQFCGLFAEFMQGEADSFYLSYWRNRQAEAFSWRQKFIDHWNKSGLKIFGPVMRHQQKPATIFLCLSMTRCGRGISGENRFAAAVKQPFNQKQADQSFIFAVHEMTHNVIDPLSYNFAQVSPNEVQDLSDDKRSQLHQLKEFAVIYAQALLYEKFLPEELPKYSKWCEALMPRLRHDFNNPLFSSRLIKETCLPTQLRATINNTIENFKESEPNLRD